MFGKSSEPEIVIVLIYENYVHVCKSYKMLKSTLSCIGNFEENIDPSHIHYLRSLGCFCNSWTSKDIFAKIKIFI